MGRIEDNEAERMERMRQERKLQEQQLKTKQVAENQQFQNFVAKSQETKKHDARGDQQRSEQNAQASRLLLARRGIDANRTAGRQAAAGAAANLRTASRAQTEARAREGLRRSLGEVDPLLEKRSGHGSGRTDAMGIGRGGEQGDKDQQQPAQKPREAGRSDAGATPGTSYAAIGQAAVQALDGMGARASNAGVSAADQAAKVRAMIEAIVKSVRQGVDEQGFGLMEITLNDDVLGGSRLTVLNSQSGIHLRVDTGELGSTQQERPNETLLKSSAHELHQAMAAAKVQLVGLEINGEKVIA